MTKYIQLSRGKSALVDDWQYEELNQHKWYVILDSKNGSYYAHRNIIKEDGKQTSISMHSVIAKTPKGMHTDHINHNTLDNREENLRVCTPSQNKCNSRKQMNNTSGYKGVNKKGNKWAARVRVGNVRTWLGAFDTPEEAAKAYNNAAKRLQGEYAHLGDQI